MESKNFFEQDLFFEYIRFPIGSHQKAPFDMKSKDGVFKFFYPVIDHIQRKTKEGRNILIHCTAGAHRAGSTVVAWLMFAQNLSADMATQLAKSKRSIIDPYSGFFDTLLEDFENSL